MLINMSGYWNTLRYLVLLVCISQGNTICLQNTSDINCQGNFLENFSQEKYINIPESNAFSLRSKSLISEGANSETSTSKTSTPSPTTNFTCKDQGRFANESDTTCRTYIFCYLLPNMTYIQQNLTCPQGTKFNKALRTCSRNYLCQIQTSTTESITSTTVSTTVTSGSETTTIAPKFNCTNQGRFANESDTTCRTYIFCYLLPNMTYIQQNLTCPQGTRFNKALRTCSRNYLCEITTSATKNISLTTTTTSDSETTTDVTPCTPASQPSPENLKKEPFTCKKNGRFSNENDINCKSYYLCISQNNSFRQYFLSCPDNQVFNPITRSCSSNYTCSNQIENFSSTTISSSNCELTGRFLNPEDTTCTSYLVCILYNNLIISKKYDCTNGTFFDLKQCSTNYQCPRSITENPNVDINTGRYLNDEDVNCSSYLIYVSDGKEVFIKKYRCKTNTFFNPVVKECSSNYICKKSETPITNRTGRISDKTNMDCSSYTVVISDGNNLISKTFRCKDDTYFDPQNQICTEDYQCKKLTTQIPKPNSTGKYINGEDISCSTYTMIISNGDYLIPKVYRCRDGTYFDPLEKLCTSNYQCPGVSIKVEFIKTTPSTGLTVATKLTKATELLIPAGLTKYTESTKFTELPEGTKHTEFIKVSNSTNNKKSTEITKPTQATEQTKLTDPTRTTEHTKRTESTELTKSINSTGSTEHTKHTEHTELTNSKDSTESTEQNKQTESTELAKSTDPTGSTKHANLTEPTAQTKLTGSTEQNKRTESTELSKSADSTGFTEQNKRTEPTELAKSTDPTESTEHTKRTESIELTKSTDSTGSTEPNKSTEHPELTKSTDSTGSIEHTKRTESTELTKSTYSTGSTEPTILTESIELTKSTDSTGSTEPNKSTEHPELTKSTDSTGSVEHTKRTESTELTKSTDSTGSTEPTILTESSELTKVTDPVESIEPTKPSELTKSADFTVSKEYAGSTERIQKCTNRGKYANEENCTSYLLCISTHDSFVSRTYSCPEKSFFDPVNQICSIGYKCNNVSTS